MIMVMVHLVFFFFLLLFDRMFLLRFFVGKWIYLKQSEHIIVTYKGIYSSVAFLSEEWVGKCFAE